MQIRELGGCFAFPIDTTMRWFFESYETRESRLATPHLWFAWHPVRLTDTPDRIVWMETVTRKKGSVSACGHGAEWWEYYESSK